MDLKIRIIDQPWRLGAMSKLRRYGIHYRSDYTRKNLAKAVYIDANIDEMHELFQEEVSAGHIEIKRFINSGVEDGRKFPIREYNSCPVCNASKINKRVRKGGWRCYRCKSEFSVPAKRSSIKLKNGGEHATRINTQ